MGRHTGVKPFKCDICGKEFISTITFKRHAIVHSGIYQKLLYYSFSCPEFSPIILLSFSFLSFRLYFFFKLSTSYVLPYQKKSGQDWTMYSYVKQGKIVDTILIEK